MFSVLISSDDTAWESEAPMRMMAERFGEYSGEEGDQLSLDNEKSLKLIDGTLAILAYEYGVAANDDLPVRVGEISNVRVFKGEVRFDFNESGRVQYDKFCEYRRRLQLDEWELNRTHWAIKDREIPVAFLQEMKTVAQKYDIALSFAGEDRQKVSEVADFLDRRKVKVFYDEYESVNLWGKDLVEHLQDVYQNQAKYCVIFISRHYAEKVWTTHERKSALVRAINWSAPESCARCYESSGLG